MCEKEGIRVFLVVGLLLLIYSLGDHRESC